MTKKEVKEEDIQPDVNIGLVGHVDHGKTTLTQSLSGKWTDTHSEELKRGITIRLGYANVSIYKKGAKLYPFKETGSKFVRNISLVDAPGHESLMATMLSGAMIMDGALVLIAANEECPQPQTKEHLAALEIVGIKKVIIIQNKIDLVSKEKALENYNQIKAYIKDTAFKDAPIIPISAFHKINIDLLLKTIQEVIPTPKNDLKKDPLMLVARSFDINKPGIFPDKVKGGVLGGALQQGQIKIGDEIEILPAKEFEGKPRHLITKVLGLMSGTTPVEEIIPGGSVAILTSLDPSIVKSDTLAGTVVGSPGKLPKIWESIKLELHLLKRVVGTKDEQDVKPIADKEILMLNVNSAATVGVVTDLKKGIASCRLKIPVCADVESRVTISRKVGNRFRLVGYGIIKD
ncbi:translation initiation factor IF-2 subunit gamma [Candidatus Woesearchaeota archaeon]|jgi:translation initiation factor 2 subunit 3|nr:translation initiation factor IF-2 subunit gamma [Candidatus Woesearchaeota archaeon]MBT4368201.1 translation initiation factor IF-2 subunit gamma [Candidatus Woesearchaeota archaeon]MBT4712690.1 translation initiation factor IF-2 subunit gamma [Candidatus Woesearchaeota archaeon]MBT6639602.1 translation initiation factor IF-2 subunit gamma [Candidatus Woesearchaeota archaeon]MBT7133774.1 translation initiation factor IF-2 subunit gamma [Candidatus Woesearchaeota archaeon]